MTRMDVMALVSTKNNPVLDFPEIYIYVEFHFLDLEHF